MGISSINCEGYGEVKETGFGKRRMTSSDFKVDSSLPYLALLASAVAATALVDSYTESKNDELASNSSALNEDGVPKNAAPITIGRLDDDGDLITRDPILNPGDHILLRPISEHSGVGGKTLDCAVGGSHNLSDNFFPLTGGVYDLKCTEKHVFGYAPKVAVYKATD